MPIGAELVRTWNKDAGAGRIPERILAGGKNKQGVIVWGKWSPRYHWRGYVCRWTNLKPGVVKVRGVTLSKAPPGRGRCRAGRALIEWTYDYAQNPTIGDVRGCRPVNFKYGAASLIRAKHLTCKKAKHLVHKAIHDRVIRPSHGALEVARRHAFGTTWTSPTPGNFRARRGRARLTFHVCWSSYTC